ncbi:MAG: hypothetical protein LBG80_12010 [Bacteroidales bacterium]|jgi:hypothetical protein|nr:hypothetical protein [Bacteroidales bacterium]
MTPNEKQQIALADAVGAAVGAVGFVAGPVAGAISTVVCGVSASLATRKAIKLQKQEVISERIPSADLPDIDNSSAKNDNNPYDYIGRTHYLLMNDFLADPTLCYGMDGEFSTSIYYKNVTEMLPNYISDIHTITFSIDDLEICLNQRNNPMQQVLQEIEITINPQLKSILIDYENYTKRCTDFESLYGYSILKEQEALNSIVFTDVEKQIALSYMSTLRWGYWYWSHFE